MFSVKSQEHVQLYVYDMVKQDSSHSEHVLLHSCDVVHQLSSMEHVQLYSYDMVKHGVLLFLNMFRYRV